MPEAPALPPCAVGSAARGEALVATASRVRSWLLIEQPGAWGRNALLESALDLTVAATLMARCRRAGVRPILIRRPPAVRPARYEGLRRRRCYLAHSGTHRSWLESLDVDRPASLLDLDLGVLASDEAPGLGRTIREPILLVCTNGRHDRCCSDLGRPLARALVSATPAALDDVWECSHIGGDRFAANLVGLPHGVYFGRVGADVGPGVADDYRKGELSLAHYRGRSSQPPFVQAAELFVRQALGLTAIDALAPTGSVTEDDDEAEVTFGVSGTLGTGSGWRVRVQRRRSPDAVVLTCRADHASAPWVYHLVDLTPF